MILGPRWSSSPVAILNLAMMAATLIIIQDSHAGLIEDGIAVAPVADVNESAPTMHPAATPSAGDDLEDALSGATDLPLAASADMNQLLRTPTNAGATPGIDSGGVHHSNSKRRRNASFSPSNGTGGGSGGGSSGSHSVSSLTSGSTASGSGAISDSSNGPPGSTQFISGLTGGSGIGSGSAGLALFANASGLSSVDPGNSSFGSMTSFSSSAILPSSIVGGMYTFRGNSAPGMGGSSAPLTFDPPLAPGFAFHSLAGDPNFASIQVTDPLPNTSLLRVAFNGQNETFAPGSIFSFPTGGVSTFTVTGISSADVQTGGEFLTSITFTQPGQFRFTETALNGDAQIFAPAVPEPGSLTLLAAGTIVLLSWRRLRQKS